MVIAVQNQFFSKPFSHYLSVNSLYDEYGITEDIVLDVLDLIYPRPKIESTQFNQWVNVWNKLSSIDINCNELAVDLDTGVLYLIDNPSMNQRTVLGSHQIDSLKAIKTVDLHKLAKEVMS